jgi:hypothetical protein
MFHSEKIDLLAAALAKFHAECPKITKDTKNDYFKSKYADLGTILAVVNPVLANCGLSVVQMPTGDNMLQTLLLHQSGQWIKGESVMRPLEAVIRRDANKNDIMGITPQALGSAITYQRRYALAAILSLCIDDDDDGNAASATGMKPGDKARSQQPVVEQETKPETKPPPVELLTDEKINDIMGKLQAATLDQLPKMEAALSNHGIRGAIKKDDWSILAAAMLDRWYTVSTSAKGLGEVANTVVAYRSKAILTDEQFAKLTEKFKTQLNTLTPENG